VTVIPVAGIRLIAAMAILGMSAVGCTNAESQPSSTIAAPATTTTATTTPATTTTSEPSPEGPLALEEFRFLEPGQYVTTEFQPTILFSLERNYVLQFLERPTFVSFTNRMLYGNETRKYKWVDFLALWADDPPDQVLDTFARSFGFDHQDPVPVSVGGLEGIQVDGVTHERQIWWVDGPVILGTYPGPLRLIIVETTAGTVVIGIGLGADADEYEDWLVIAEEILSGVTFVEVAP